jgi:hypothetical protein
MRLGGVGEDQVLVDLVGHRERVVLLAERRDQVQLGRGEDLAGRVVRRVEQHQPGTRAERGAQLTLVEGVAPVRAGTQRDRPAYRPGQRDRRRVRVVVGLEADHLVARLAQPQDRGGDRLGGARGDHHLAVRVALQTPEALFVGRDRAAQRRDAGQRRILVRAAVQQGLGRGGEHLRRAVGVREALAEVDRAGAHRQCGHLAEDRGAERPHPFDQRIDRHSQSSRGPGVS